MKNASIISPADTINLNLERINVELVKGCNINCIMCPTNRFNQSYREIDPGIYGRILEQMHESRIRIIRYCGDGEPLLNINLPGYISKAHEFGIKSVELITNGTLLSPVIISQLFLSDLNLIVISLDACTDDTYQMIRNGKFHLEEINENIIRLLEYRKCQSWNLEVQVNFVIQEFNRHEMKGFSNKWGTLADKVNFIKKRSFFNTKISQDHFICNILLRKLYISCEGEMYPCFFMHYPAESLGNVQDNTIARVWEQRNQLHYKDPVTFRPLLCSHCIH